MPLRELGNEIYIDCTVRVGRRGTWSSFDLGLPVSLSPHSMYNFATRPVGASSLFLFDIAKRYSYARI